MIIIGLKFQEFMVNYVIIGGPGSGKTTFAKALAGVYEARGVSAEIIWTSWYTTRVPLALQLGGTNLFSLSREEYKEVIFNHAHDSIPPPPPRPQMDAFGAKVKETFGETMDAELLAVLMDHPVSIATSMAGRANVAALRQSGCYVIGLTCSLETHVARRLGNPKDIDPVSRAEMENIIRGTNQFYEIPDSFLLAHRMIDTDRSPKESYIRRAEEIMEEHDGKVRHCSKSSNH